VNRAQLCILVKMMSLAHSCCVGAFLLLSCAVLTLNAAPDTSSLETFANVTSGNSTQVPTTQPASAGTTKAKTSANPATRTSVSPTVITTSNPKIECEARNKSCEFCLKDTRCMYCKTDSSCIPYPIGEVIPSSSVCALDKARWAVCWLNFEAMLISVSVIGGIIIIGVTTFFICCCCCRGGGKKKLARDDARHEEQKMERKARQEDRRTERKGRLDEIRRKYGLMKEDEWCPRKTAQREKWRNKTCWQVSTGQILTSTDPRLKDLTDTCHDDSSEIYFNLS